MVLSLNIPYNDYLYYYIIRFMHNLIFMIMLQKAIMFRDSLCQLYQNLYLINFNNKFDCSLNNFSRFLVRFIILFPDCGLNLFLRNYIFSSKHWPDTPHMFGAYQFEIILSRFIYVWSFVNLDRNRKHIIDLL